MADPLSIASGVVGLLSFGIQVTNSLVDFYSAYKDQTPALAKITLNLENLQIDKAAVGCREIIEELNEECQKFQKDSTLSLKDRIQVVGRRATYPFRKSTLQKLEEDIGEIRENLSLALDVLQLGNQTALEDGISELRILVERTNTIHISAAIRDWLKAPDATIEHNATCEKRHIRTGLWLVNGQKFQNWLVKRDSFPWLNVFAGCGKSVLCLTAIERTFLERQRQPGIGIGFFYFSFNDESKRDSSGMLRALLLQLSAQLEGGEKALQELHTSHTPGTPPVKALLNSLRQTICKFRDTYILLDALDESPRDHQREDVLDAVEKIRQWDLPTLHLLVTSRNEVDIRDSLGTLFDQDIQMRNPETDIDIQSFISYQLSNNPKLQQWKSRHEEIQEKLTNNAEGVFRYVECQLLALKRARIRNQLDICLHSLPRDLDETYERMLCSIDEEYIEEARLILTFLCVSDRPLTVRELIDVLVIDVRASEWQVDREGRSFSQDDIFDICLGLIEVAVIEDDDGESTTIARIAHFSVQEYLESDRISQQGAAKFTIRKEPAHTEMAQICLVYLLDPALSNGELDEEKLEIFPLAEFAAMQCFRFYNSSGKGKCNIEPFILKLFQDQPGSFATWVRLHNLDSLWPPTPNFELAIEDIPSPLYYAGLLGLQSTLNALIDSWAEKTTIYTSLDTETGFFGNVLQAASFGLLSCRAFNDRYYENVLQDASFGLLSGRTFNGTYFDNVLQAASFVLLSGRTFNDASYEKTVRTLLDHGANVHTQGGYFGSALQAASCTGHAKLVQILLDHSADVNAPEGPYGTALQGAALGGYMKLVQILLDHSADVNAPGRRYGTALQAAALGGHTKLVQILLDHSADVNAPEGPNGTALQVAIGRDYGEVVQILLANDAEVRPMV